MDGQSWILSIIRVWTSCRHSGPFRAPWARDKTGRPPPDGWGVDRPAPLQLGHGLHPLWGDGPRRRRSAPRSFLEGTVKVLVLIRQHLRWPEANGALRAVEQEPRPAPGAEDSPLIAFSQRRGNYSPRRLCAEFWPLPASLTGREKVGPEQCLRGDRARTYELRSVRRAGCRGCVCRGHSGPASSPP